MKQRRISIVGIRAVPVFACFFLVGCSGSKPEKAKPVPKSKPTKDRRLPAGQAVIIANLKAQLASSNREVRKAAITAAGNMGKEAASLAPVLLKILDTTMTEAGRDAYVRARVLVACSKIGISSPQLLKQLGKEVGSVGRNGAVLRDNREWFNKLVRALIRYGDAAVPPLMRLLDKERSRRWFRLEVLRQLQPIGTAGYYLIDTILSDIGSEPKPKYEAAAVAVLARMGHHAAQRLRDIAIDKRQDFLRRRVAGSALLAGAPCADQKSWDSAARVLQELLGVGLGAELDARLLKSLGAAIKRCKSPVDKPGGTGGR